MKSFLLQCVSAKTRMKQTNKQTTEYFPFTVLCRTKNKKLESTDYERTRILVCCQPVSRRCYLCDTAPWDRDDFKANGRPRIERKTSQYATSSKHVPVGGCRLRRHHAGARMSSDRSPLELRQVSSVVRSSRTTEPQRRVSIRGRWFMSIKNKF